MANTITNTQLLAGQKTVIQYVTIQSDGSNETDLVIYDSSAVATLLGKPDPLSSSIKKVYYASNTVAGLVRLEWDATTDVTALSLPRNEGCKLDFTCFGNLKNTSGTGKTGDITLTTTGLATGESLTLILEVDPSFTQ